jgi:flagellar biosynthesis protein FlhF
MKLLSVVADDAGAALEQIRKQLGPQAVVLGTRPFKGKTRFWRRSKLEVLACSQDQNPAPICPPQESISWNGSCESPASGPGASPRRWPSISWLESMGLQKSCADRLEACLSADLTEKARSPEEEWSAVTEALLGFWRPPPALQPGDGRPHVFMGPPGSGKTTALCKWLAQMVLMEGRSAVVCRLDGPNANASERLNLYCETLGVRLERTWRGAEPGIDLFLLDFPGIETWNHEALGVFEQQLASLPNPHIHLVLNTAYETSLLFAQFKAFASLGIEDLIFTHLDEEKRVAKIWNFVLGTNCFIRFLGAGQKIPGEFLSATPNRLLPAGKP